VNECKSVAIKLVRLLINRDYIINIKITLYLIIQKTTNNEYTGK